MDLYGKVQAINVPEIFAGGIEPFQHLLARAMREFRRSKFRRHEPKSRIAHKQVNFYNPIS
jgi:hypothetical protein